MSRFSDEERERARAEAEATLQRVADLIKRGAKAMAFATASRWPRPEPEPPKRRERDDTHSAPAAQQQTDWSAWERWADAKIAAALEVERAHLIEVIGQALGQALDQQCDEHKRDLSEKISELRLELAKFANVVAELRISSVGEGGRSVLDLPPLPTRGRSTVN